MELRHIFTGNLTTYVRVMWRTAEKLGKRFDVSPSSFCRFWHLDDEEEGETEYMGTPPDPIVESAPDPISIVEPNDKHLVSYFYGQRYWRKFVQIGTKAHTDFYGTETWHSLIYGYKWAMDFPGTPVTGEIDVEAMTYSESLLTVRADDSEWSELESTWQLIRDEMRASKRLRQLDRTASDISTQPAKPDGLVEDSGPKKRISPRVQRCHEVIRNLRAKGYTAEQIWKTLKRNPNLYCSLKTVYRDLDYLKLPKP
jgi:hypothetical protein